MAMHTVIASGAGVYAAAAGGMTAQAVHSDTIVMMVPAVISALAAVIGAGVALVSYLRHRTSSEALAEHQIHDDERFDQLERLIAEMSSGPGH